MSTHYYSAELVSGKYNINPSNRLDENGKQIFIESDITLAFSGSGFSVDYIETGMAVNFNNTLTDGEIVVLSGVINTHKNYTISPIENLHQSWKKNYIDYKKARSELKDLVASSGFDNLTLVERKIASKWFVISLAQRSTVHTLGEQVVNGKSFHDSSVIARNKRAEAAISAMYNYLPIQDAFLVVDDVVNNTDLLVKYVKFGREGTLEDGMVGIFDYLGSRSGSIYDGSGFLNRGLVPNVLTVQQLSDAALNIFKSGIYQ